MGSLPEYGNGAPERVHVGNAGKLIERCKLAEALALRSVGRDSTKTSSAAGVMGVTFLLAHNKAMARAEAMELRGYGTHDKAKHSKIRAMRPNTATVVYALCIAVLVALFAYLEVVAA